LQDIAWYNADGNQVSDEGWNTEWNKSLAIVLNGQTLQVTDENGVPVTDDSFLLIVNAAPEGVEFTMPASPSGHTWKLILDTENIEEPHSEVEVEEKIIVGGRALKVLSSAAST
jgi:isoamylase